MGSKGGRAWAAIVVLLCTVAPVSAYDADDFITICFGGSDRSACEDEQKQFVRNLDRAMKRDYQAQRNVAFCIQTGCEGAVRVNPMLACAWRLLIVYSGSLKVDPTDTANLDLCLSRLKPPEVIGATAQAETLYKTIYEQPMPKMRKR